MIKDKGNKIKVIKNHFSSEKRIFIYIILMLAMLFWGLSFIWLKVVYEVYKPFTVVFLRLLSSAIFLFFIGSITGSKEKVAFKDLKYLMLLAFFDPFLYFIGESFGLQLISATIASIIIATTPVFTPFFTYFFLKEKLKITGVIGLVFSFFGVLILTVDRNMHLKYSFKGLMFMFFAVFSAIGYIITAKKISFRFKPLTVVKYQNLIASIYFLPLFLIFEFKNFIKITPDFRIIANILALSILPSTLSFIFYNISIKKISVNEINILSNTIPLFTAISAYLVLHEKFGYDKIIGMTVILSGIIISQIKRKSSKEEVLREY